jgi:hypothetical protein
MNVVSVGVFEFQKEGKFDTGFGLLSDISRESIGNLYEASHWRGKSQRRVSPVDVDGFTGRFGLAGNGIQKPAGRVEMGSIRAFLREQPCLFECAPGCNTDRRFYVAAGRNQPGLWFLGW